MAPWHFDVEVAPGLRTSDFNLETYEDPDKRNVAIINPAHMGGFFARYYPKGLATKSLLDVGCNAGAYCFMAAERGAARVLGLEVRTHWLEQAEFLREVRFADLSGVEFALDDIQAYVERVEPFDVTLLKGVLYHLADPIHVLLKLAAATRETLLIDTNGDDDIPEHAWAPMGESTTQVMSGVHGLAWRPGGPMAIVRVLQRVGYSRFDVPYWWRSGPDQIARFQVIASRPAGAA